VEIWNEDTAKWLQAQIEDVKVAWINDGTQLKVTHALRYVEEGQVKNSKPKKVYKFRFKLSRMKELIGDIHNPTPLSEEESEEEEDNDGDNRGAGHHGGAGSLASATPVDTPVDTPEGTPSGSPRGAGHASTAGAGGAGGAGGGGGGGGGAAPTPGLAHNASTATLSGVRLRSGVDLSALDEHGEGKGGDGSDGGEGDGDGGGDGQAAAAAVADAAAAAALGASPVHDVGEDTDAQALTEDEDDTDTDTGSGSDETDETDSSAESDGGYTFGATTVMTDEVSLDTRSVATARTKKTAKTFRSHRSRQHVDGGGIFGNSTWVDLSTVRHNVLEGDIGAVEERRKRIEAENEAKEDLDAEVEWYWSVEERVLNKVLKKRRAKKLAKFGRIRDANMAEIRKKVGDVFVRQLDGLKENHRSNLELWEELEYEAHQSFLSFQQGWKQDASEAVMEMIGPVADIQRFRQDGILKDETALYDLVHSEDLKRRADETLAQAKRRKKLEAKLRKLVTIDDARRLVWKKYVNDNVVVAMREANKRWEARLDDLKEELEEQEDERRRVRKERIAAIRRAKAEHAKAIAAEMDVKRSAFRHEHMRIPNFKRACDDRNGPACPHLRQRSWGHKYGKGVKCIDCGVELTDMQNVMDAANGPLDDAVRELSVVPHRRHYFAAGSAGGGHGGDGDGDGNGTGNGGGVRKYTADMVEREKFRVEKERAYVEAADVQFYDFLHPKIIRQADARHGLDPFDREDDIVHAPHMRQVDAAKKAAFKDGLQYFGRVRNFTARITELGDEREDLLIEKSASNNQLQFLYDHTDFLAARIQELGDEHDIAFEKVQRLEAAEEAHAVAAKKLRRAQRALKRAQDTADKAQQHMLVSNENARVCEGITEDMMRWWTWARDLELYAVSWQKKAQETCVGGLSGLGVRVDNIATPVFCVLFFCFWVASWCTT